MAPKDAQFNEVCFRLLNFENRIWITYDRSKTVIFLVFGPILRAARRAFEKYTALSLEFSTENTAILLFRCVANFTSVALSVSELYAFESKRAHKESFASQKPNYLTCSDSNPDISKTLKATDVKFGTHLNNRIAVFFMLNSSEGAVYFQMLFERLLKWGRKREKSLFWTNPK